MDRLKQTSITIRLTAAEKRELEKAAKRDRRDLSSFTRLALEDYLSRVAPKKRPQRLQS